MQGFGVSAPKSAAGVLICNSCCTGTISSAPEIKTQPRASEALYHYITPQLNCTTPFFDFLFYFLLTDWNSGKFQLNQSFLPNNKIRCCIQKSNRAIILFLPQTPTAAIDSHKSHIVGISFSRWQSAFRWTRPGEGGQLRLCWCELYAENISSAQQPVRPFPSQTPFHRGKEKIAFILGDINIGANASTFAFKKYLFDHLKLPKVKRTVK